MNKIIYCLIVCFLCLCTSATNVADGSITITTNGLATVENANLHIQIDVDGRFELHIKDITGQSVLFITGSGPAEFDFLTTAFRPGAYQIAVRDIDGKIIYTQDMNL